MRQTSLVILEKGYEVSFTFIGGSEDEVNELIEKLSFAPRKRVYFRLCGADTCPSPLKFGFGSCYF